MISKFNKYVMLLFLKYSIAVQLLVTIVSLLAEAASQTGLAEKYDASIKDVVIYNLMKVPFLIYSSVPLSIVFSTLLVMITLIKHNELTAYVSLGGKIRNLAFPFIYCGVAVAALLLFTANSINPKVMYLREKFASEHIFKKQMDVRPTLTDIWLKMKENKFIHIRVVDPEKMEFHYVTEFMLDKDLQVQSIETYNSAKKRDKGWLLHNQKKYSMQPIPKKTYGRWNILADKPIFDELSEMPFLKPRYVSISDIYKVREVMQEQKVNTSKYTMQIYKIFAHSLNVIVIIMTIFPLTINFNRNYSHIKVAAVTVSAGFAYWMLVSSCLSLGKNGVLSPFFGAFLPIIVFAMVSAYLIYRKEHSM
ncbi:MAG: LptF/LptG family permease [Deferribacterales bacterium]